MAEMMGIDQCWLHHGTFSFDPEFVVVIWIDPETRLPYDISPEPGGAQRSVARPVCDPCIRKVNKIRAERGLPLFEPAASRAGRRP